MRRTHILIVLSMLLLLLCCCGAEKKSTEQTCAVMVRVMRDCTTECAEDESLFHWYLYDGVRTPLNEIDDLKDCYIGEDEMSALLTDLYGLFDLKWYDAAIVRMEGARAFELAVLSVPEEETDSVVSAWQEHLTARRGDFTGYLPEQADLIDHAEILTSGQQVALLICENPKDAADAFEACYGEGRFAHGLPAYLKPMPEQLPNGRYVFTDPGEDDMTIYDTSAILNAWRTGDDTGLSDNDSKVLKAARKVLEENIDDSMTPAEKEYALYQWITGTCKYDQRHYDSKGCPRTAYEPYGPLVEHTGVCLGFATAFQLLMDMSDIECITVTGGAYFSRENHAWNMVRMDGDWYCVDPTWDLNQISVVDGETICWYSYYNVTSDWMAETDHQWDYDNVPEAVTEWTGVGSEGAA